MISITIVLVNQTELKTSKLNISSFSSLSVQNIGGRCDHCKMVLKNINTRNVIKYRGADRVIYKIDNISIGKRRRKKRLALGILSRH